MRCYEAIMKEMEEIAESYKRSCPQGPRYAEAQVEAIKVQFLQEKLQQALKAAAQEEIGMKAKSFVIYNKVKAFIDEVVVRYCAERDEDEMEDREARAKAISLIRSSTALVLIMTDKCCNCFLVCADENCEVTTVNWLCLGNTVEEAERTFKEWYEKYGDPGCTVDDLTVDDLRKLKAKQ